MPLDFLSGSHNVESHLPLAWLTNNQINWIVLGYVHLDACKALRKSSVIENILKKGWREHRDITVEFPLGGKEGWVLAFDLC